jgi:crotonobetainyl-CoA:carnitine CoA-transferase CaiB-like acyl-CoA transferase
VIKIEPPGGEQSRRNRPEVPGLDVMFFLVFNANKRSVSIDLMHPDGRALFLKMVEHLSPARWTSRIDSPRRFSQRRYRSQKRL